MTTTPYVCYQWTPAQGAEPKSPASPPALNGEGARSTGLTVSSNTALDWLQMGLDSHRTMTATLTFNLPDEQELYETASNAEKWRGMVVSLNEYIRDRTKFSVVEPTPEIKSLEDWFEKEMDERNLTV